jgi:hypothetical protein
MKTRRIELFVLIVAVALVGTMALAATTSPVAADKTDGGKGGEGRDIAKWNFDDQKAGTIPAGWKVATTGAKAKRAKWEVVADATAPSAPHAIALTKTENTGEIYNLLTAGETKLKDLALDAKIRVMAGKANQGSGVFWRAADPNNYYMARWTPLSNNFRVYCIKDGKARRLVNVNIKLDRTKWHTIQIHQAGEQIVAFMDGKKLVDIKDATFAKAGSFGLLTKADAAAAFDDIRVREITAESPKP